MAVTVALHSSNVRFSSFVLVSVVGTVITITATIEPGSVDDLGSMEFDGLTASTNYTCNITLLNSSGAVIPYCTVEILDPSGDAEDVDDPTPQPSWVPPGFSTSNDDDGLSYAQGSSVPRTSSHFATVTPDELNDDRDFLNFHDGSVPIADSFDLSFGLRDNLGSPGDNQPFLLAFRFNTTAVVTVPVDGSVPCCADRAEPGEGNPGGILPPNPFESLPAWIAACVGGGEVPSAADPVDAESWA